MGWSDHEIHFGMLVSNKVVTTLDHSDSNLFLGADDCKKVVLLSLSIDQNFEPGIGILLLVLHSFSHFSILGIGTT